MLIEKIRQILKNEPSYRSKQAIDFVYKNFGDDWEKSNLPKNIKKKLSKKCKLQISAKIIVSKKENAQKALVSLEDGEEIEAVLMKHQNERNTVCVSSAVGCALGCIFCATGEMGFKRNLTADEIVNQVLLFARKIKKENIKITNVVFMGMGEPFLNYNNVVQAIKIINEEIGIGSRNISISTCGIIEGIKKMANENKQINLALSLHAPSDRLREKIMPINKKYPIEKILNAVADYTKKTKRRVMIEYILIKNINDSEQSAKELKELLKSKLGNMFFVNLIIYNKTGLFMPSEKRNVKIFKDVLKNGGITVTERWRFGADIVGACGQLTNKK